MNNEERILSILEQMQTDISGLKEGQAETNQRLTKLEQGQAMLEQGQAMLEQGQSRLETEVAEIKERVILIENDHGKRLGAIYDGYMLLHDKLEPLPAAVEALQDDMSVVKAVVISHSKDINKFKNVI